MLVSYCNEIDIVIVRASMRVLRGITVVFKCILASCRIKRQFMASTESQCTRNTRDIRDSR